MIFLKRNATQRKHFEKNKLKIKKNTKMRLSVKLRRFLVVGVYIVSISILLDVSRVDAQRSFLEKFINEYRVLRGGLFKFIGRSDTDASYYYNYKRQVNYSDGIHSFVQLKMNLSGFWVNLNFMIRFICKQILFLKSESAKTIFESIEIFL